jgi:hypothetical protein
MPDCEQDADLQINTGSPGRPGRDLFRRAPMRMCLAACGSTQWGGCWLTPWEGPRQRASIDAMIAWMGIRPVAISWLPARRAAEAKGAARRFSQMSTPAVLPGSIAAAMWSTVGSVPGQPALLRALASNESWPVRR